MSRMHAADAAVTYRCSCLAAADLSFAMGAGSDVAIETASVTVMANDLAAVSDAIELSRASIRKIRQNLFFAFIYNVLGIPLAALGMLSRSSPVARWR